MLCVLRLANDWLEWLLTPRPVSGPAPAQLQSINWLGQISAINVLYQQMRGFKGPGMPVGLCAI